MKEDVIKYIKFIANLLEEKGYKIDYYNATSFHANHKENYWRCIEVGDNVDGEIEICSNICLYTRGASKQECLKKLSNMFDETQKDIDFVNSTLDNIYSKDNVIRMCQICGVPEKIIEKLKENKDE